MANLDNSASVRNTGVPSLSVAPAKPPRSGRETGQSFADLLRIQQGLAERSGGGKPESVSSPGGVKFSAHAQTRLQSRKIDLEAAHLDRLDGAVQKAQSKGSRDALVLLDDLAMVVSVANKTVVTVVDRDNLKQNVFTNIDSAVIA